MKELSFHRIFFLLSIHMVRLTYIIPALWDAKTGGSSEVRSSKTSLANIVKPQLY